MVEQLTSPAGAPVQSPRRGIVYILTNPAMEGYIKIGRTNGDSSKAVQDRMKQIDGTGVPRSFECEYAVLVEDYEKVEKALHMAFGDRRVRTNREFFEDVDPHRVKAVLQLLEIKEVTPSESGQLDINADGASEKEKPPRRPNFRFQMVDIPVGAELEWVDDPEMKCKVVEGNRVSYGEKNYSLSALAQELKPGERSLAGPMFWVYDGETLTERRRRFEDEASEGGD